jgi:predicted transcriptional regulator
MGRKTPIPRPTDAELAILQVLWDRGPATVRDVYDVVRIRRPLVYTTTLKLLQIMTEKGLVLREEVGRQHVYRARRPREDTQRHLVGDLLDRAFGGSTATLLMQALASRRTSREELREIRRLLAELEKDHD